MKSRNLIVIVVIAFILILGGCGCSGYNSIVTLDQETKNSWAKVEGAYQRRMDIFKNVERTVTEAANYEKSTLEAVVKARAEATQIKVDINDPKSIEAYQKAQDNLNSSFSRLIASFEQYPNLKATDAYRDFQTEISGTENRINVARNDFSNSVNAYNVKIKTFPNNLFASLFGFKEKAYYKAQEGAENAPDVFKK